MRTFRQGSLAQIAYKNSYYSGYGPQRVVRATYENNEQEYRNLYYRLHAEVDGPLDRVRKALTIDTSREKVIFRNVRSWRLIGGSWRSSPEMVQSLR